MNYGSTSGEGIGVLTERSSKPRLLVVSHVLPYPGNAGQQQRVAYTLQALREAFEVHFLTYVAPSDVEATRSRLVDFCDRALVLPSLTRRNRFSRGWHTALGVVYSLATGLKRSNYEIGCVEFSTRRLRETVVPSDYKCVLYEYNHAAKSSALFRAAGVPTVLDMHNLLWKTRELALARLRHIPHRLSRRWLVQYRRYEEASWAAFDGVIAINRAEARYVDGRLPASTHRFYVPMGVDLSLWPPPQQPATPRRVAFYGGLGSRGNQESARRCLDRIMPALWARYPDLELWLVGSNPPDSLKALAGPRVKVTGFVERVGEVLRTMSFVLCPWSGTYGFRSRLVEVMALGVPVVATPEAVDGMEMDHEQGILLGTTDTDLSREALRLLSDAGLASEQSQRARGTAERLYGLGNTYGRFTDELRQWLR